MAGLLVIAGGAISLAAALTPASTALAQEPTSDPALTRIDSKQPSSAGSDADFAKVVKPFLKNHCVRCHGPKKNKGELVLHAIKNDLDADAGAQRWTNILNQLTFDEMPPPEEKLRPKPIETAKIVGWIKQRLRETGKAEGYVKKLLAPEYGNWVSHEKLFSGDIQTPPYSPSRLWRLSP
ncbi:MAG: hypothetical protein N2C14_07475, partial [Planctomycetales bacterium]